MSRSFSFLSRRGFLGRSLAVGLGTGAVAVPAWFAVPGAFAEELARTPRLTEGPFYPPRLPLDTDNDLIIVGNSTTPAVGEITHLSGRVLSGSGEPVQGVVVEIWQCDAKGVYLAQGSQRGNDPNFQGFGKFAVNGKGEYRFRTIKPVPYPGRTPHIHFKVKKGDRELLTTQLFINGHPQNRGDGVLRGLSDPVDRELVLVDFVPLQESKTGELSARFDIVLGRTPSDRPEGRR